MSESFHLPCPCGKGVSVGVGQAGSRVSCVCGAELEVPKLREIRLLKSVTTSDALPRGSSPERQVTASRLLFGACLIATFVGIVSVASLLQERSKLNLGPPVEVETKAELDNFDNIPKAQLLDLWKRYSTMGPMGFPGSPWQPGRDQYAHLSGWLRVALIFSTISLVAAVGTGLMAMAAPDAKKTGR